MAPSNEGEKPNFCQNLAQQCSAFGKFLYNSENGEVMGRSGQSWAKIGFFYLIFYGFLAGFFSAMLAVFMSTIEKPGDGGKPKLTQFIKNQPGLTRLDSYEGTLKTYDAMKANESAYVKFVKKYFEDKITNNPLYSGPCPISLNDSISKPCYAPFTEYGPCAPSMNTTFGLDEKKPCVFIRVNKVYGWMPEGNGNYLKLECSGAGFDNQYPEGFLLNGFPFEGGKNHELPYVAVKIDSEVQGGVKVRCTLKGPGIEVSESFNPSRAFGRIEIRDIKANK